MTNEEIFSLLRPHLMRVSGVPELILANPNRPSPLGEYASLQIQHGAQERGQANISTKKIPGNKVVETIKAQVMVSCVLEFYRGKAHQYASKIFQINKRQDVTWDLFKKNISIRNTGQVLDLTELQSHNYEPRARIDIYLWLEIKSQYELNNILKVKAVAEYENGSTIQSVDISLKGE